MSSIIKVNTVQDTDGNNIINENANTITIGASGDTISIPAGATLANNGTATGFASIAWQSSIVTAATHTASAGQGLWLDTSSNAITVTLPASPSVGDQIILTDYARNWGTNAVTLNLNSLKFQGGSVNPVYDTNGESVDIVYSGTTKGWIPNSDGAVALEGITTYDIEYLLVAGGGSGGSRNSGGGGAGGYTTNFTGTKITIQAGSVYTVTVGGGGASPATESIGNDGDDSVLSGAGIATVTAIGGGGGGNGSNAGRDGGSGGGSGSFQNTTFGAGTAGQGNNGGTGMGSGHPYGAGGGGGAGAVGGNASGGPGAGGAGLASTITGSSVTRAGGGGGNSYTSGGAGGSGGGGAGVSSGDGNAGTANTGGGGGGCNQSTTRGGAGGSGVIILRVPTASYSSTTTGSPTVSTSGSDTIMVFNGSGSYTG
tara:strand:+ start:16 stop:1296 length:1281 start_codon:yes stop_codon:yes gene_type:complete